MIAQCKHMVLSQRPYVYQASSYLTWCICIRLQSYEVAPPLQTPPHKKLACKVTIVGPDWKAGTLGGYYNQYNGTYLVNDACAAGCRQLCTARDTRRKSSRTTTGGTWQLVTLTLTAHLPGGVQFDRTGALYIGRNEVDVLGLGLETVMAPCLAHHKDECNTKAFLYVSVLVTWPAVNFRCCTCKLFAQLNHP